MKNIIKRGTSLLLVLAMLLSFAAVVGAEEPTTTTSEKILTLTVEDAVVKAGETTYIPAYVQGSTDNIIMSMNLSAISENSAVQITGVYPAKPLRWDGDDWEYDESTKGVLTLSGATAAAPETKKPLLTWAVSKKKDGFTATAEKQLLCYIEVLATETTTAQVSLCAKPGAEESMFATYVEGAHVDSHSKNKVEFISGTAVVIPADATLPTVILTQSSFAAPTMATYDPEQGVDLLNYLKIVDKDGNLHDASSAADTSITGNYVSNGALKLMPTSGNSGNIIVNNLHAADDASITASATLTYTVTKDTVRTPWRAGFSTHNGKYKTQADFDADFANHPPKAPVYNGGAEHNSTSVYPNVFDQYGKVMEGYSFVPLVTLYNAADHTTPLANEAGNADPAYSAVHFNRNPTTGKWASDTLYYTKELKKDVWCKIELGVIDPDGEKANIPADTLEFLIQSQYPQAASATVVLGDMNGNEFPSGPVTTIDIPYGTTENKTFSIIVKEFRQADGKTMPEGTEPSATDVTIALDGTYTGVSISNDNKLVIDKTAQAGTVTVKATLNGKELGTLTLTLQKAASKAADAGVYDRENKTANTNSKVLPTLSGVDAAGKATLPGIREGDKLVLTFGPGCVVDQYDEIYQVEGKNFLRPSQYALYKQSSTNPETYELCAEAERSVNAEGVVTATIKNSLDSDGNLRVQPGTYKFGTYNDNFFNGTTRFDLNQLLMSEPFELVYGESEYTGTASYTGGAAGTTAPTVEVPYQYGTETKANTITVSADIKDQYNTTLVSDPYTYTLDEGSIKLNNKQIETGDITFDGESGLFTVNSSAAKYFGDKTEIELKAKMTATYGTGANEKVENIPISITLRKDASKLAHLKVTGTASDGTTGFTKEATILDDDVTASYNLIVPNEGSRTYTIALSDVEDQYGTALTDKVSRAVVTSGLTAADALKYDKATKTLTVRSDAAGGKAVLTFTESGTTTGHKVELTLNFAQMSFVNSDGADYKVGMWLNTNPKDYAGQTWAELYNQIKWGAAADPTVHIENEDGTAGQDVTSSVKVVVKKDGAEVFDSSKTYTEQPKANAGTYTIELIYVKDEGEGKTNSYPIDSFTNFTISPKTVKITVNGAITKEYDGTANLPDVTLAVTAYETLNVDKSVLKFAQENVGTDINVELTSADANCLKTASGEPATNYTADLSELKGTITARKLIVTPNKQTFTYGQDTEINAALASEYTVSNNLEGTKAAKITGSMKLTDTTSGADVTVYNAGTYNVALGNLSLTGTSAGNYQLELASGTHWTISKKSADPFNVTLEAEYGINGSELYAMMKAAKVTVDGQEVNLNTLYNVEALYIKDVDGNNVPKTDALVNAGEYTVTSLPATTLGIANYEFKTAPTLKIKVNPHTLTSADIQSTDNWGAKDFTGEEQTFTAFKVSFTYNERTIDLVENQDYVIVDNSNKGIYSVVTLRIKAADGSTNYTGEARAPQSWSIRAFKVRTGDLEIYQTNTLTYDGTPKTAEFAVRVISTDQTRQKVLSHFTIANNIVDMWGNTATDAGEHTAGGSFAKGFSKADGGVNEFTWKILKSDKSPIQNQTASTKYGQPGSAEISVSDGAAKGLDTSKLSVSIVTDTDNIISGTPSVKFENGKITVNWQLQGDATTIDKSAKLRVTVAETDNYKQYTFDVDVTVTAKTPQINFGFTTATDATVGYAEDTYNNPVQNAKTTPAYTSSNQNVATVASNGVVTILDVGTTIITANAPENGEYASATASYTLTVVASPLTVTASSATMTANDSVPSFTASVTGLKRGQTTAQVFQTLTASAATDGKTAGTYAVNASATLKTDFVPRYTLRFVPGTLTVNPAQTAIDVVLPIIIGGNTCANGYANCACESFYDLDASRWYHEAIDWAYSLGLMNGTTKSTFGPNAAATRAQTWTMLARIAGQDTRRSSTWYEVGQKWAMNLGITDGTNPMGSLTREQLAAMLYRYVGSPAVNGTLTFTDSANVSAWARNAMIWAVQNGILDGVGGNRLNPKGTTTRAQAAAIFMRFSKLINK